MSLKISEIKHIASLSKLGLTEKELKNYAEQLGVVLKYIDQLAEVDTLMVDNKINLEGEFNILRDDKPKNWPEDELKISLDQTNISDDGQVRVSRVLD